MKLLKVRDNKNRPINNLDVIMKAIFGNNIPKEFIPEGYYMYGTLVTQIGDDGTLHIWECKVAGIYEECSEPCWNEWSIEPLMSALYGDEDPDENTARPLYEIDSIEIPVTITETEDKVSIISNNTWVSDTFSFPNFSGPADRLDVYVRREDVDCYVMDSEYTVSGNSILVELDKESFYNERSTTTLLLPPGRVISEDEKIDYWYSEDMIRKEYSEGLNIKNYNLMDDCVNNKDNLKETNLGYRLYDLQVVAVRTLVKSPYGITHADIFDIESHDPIGTGNGTKTITIPIPIEPTRDVSDELYVTFNEETQLVTCTCKNGFVQQVKFKFSIHRSADKNTKLFVVGYKSTSVLSRMLLSTDVIVKLDSEFINNPDIIFMDGNRIYTAVPMVDELKYNPLTVEIFYDRQDTSWYGSGDVIWYNGKCYVDLNPDRFVEGRELLFHITYSVSQMLNFKKEVSFDFVRNWRQTFRFKLPNFFTNDRQWTKVFVKSRVVDPEYVTLNKSYGFITNLDRYSGIEDDGLDLVTGNHIAVKLFGVEIVNDNIYLDQSGLGYELTNIRNTASFPILKSTDTIPIPFINYDMGRDDFLLFKSGGVLVSSSKWYIDDYHVKILKHEVPFYEGDYVDFKMIDRDSSIMVTSEYTEMRSVGGVNYCILGEIPDNIVFHMLFTASGEYISRSKYEIYADRDNHGNIIRGIQFSTDSELPLEIEVGKGLEFIYGVYEEGDHANTLIMYDTISVGNESVTEITHPMLDMYNPKIDTLLLFHNDSGLYIGERFYHIDSGSIVIDEGGTEFFKGSGVDFYWIRSISSGGIRFPSIELPTPPEPISEEPSVTE